MPKANENINQNIDEAIARHLEDKEKIEVQSKVYPDIEVKKTLVESMSKDNPHRYKADSNLLGSPDVEDELNPADSATFDNMEKDVAQDKATDGHSNYKLEDRMKGQLYRGEPINPKDQLNGVYRVEKPKAVNKESEKE